MVKVDEARINYSMGRRERAGQGSSSVDQFVLLLLCITYDVELSVGSPARPPARSEIIY